MVSLFYHTLDALCAHWLLLATQLVGRLDNSAVSATGAKLAFKSNEEIAVQVKSIPLDEVIPDSERVLLIKIDVQGWEYHVLKGAKKLLSRKGTEAPYLIYEEDERLLKASNSSKREIREFLHTVGYHHCTQHGTDAHCTKTGWNSFPKLPQRTMDLQIISQRKFESPLPSCGMIKHGFSCLWSNMVWGLPWKRAIRLSCSGKSCSKHFVECRVSYMQKKLPLELAFWSVVRLYESNPSIFPSIFHLPIMWDIFDSWGFDCTIL